MDLRKIDLNLLVMFEALLDTRSATQAGQRLGISQPATSYALARLRETFNDPLFVRINNRMQPTPRAGALAAPVRSVLAKVRTEVLQFVEFDAARSEKVFTLCMSDVGETVFLPPLVRAVMKEAPAASLRSVYMPPARLEEAMEGGEVDLALGYFPDLHRAGVYQRRLMSSGFACLARRGNPHVGRRLTLARYLDAPHVSVRAEGRIHEIIERYFARQKIVRRAPLTVPHFLALFEIIPQTDLIATVPAVMGRSIAMPASLCVHPLPVRPPDIPVNQFWHRRFHRDPANQWLRGIVRRLFQGPDG